MCARPNVNPKKSVKLPDRVKPSRHSGQMDDARSVGEAEEEAELRMDDQLLVGNEPLFGHEED